VPQHRSNTKGQRTCVYLPVYPKRPFMGPEFENVRAAGVYLASVFATRGFGIAAGIHIVFNLAVKLTLTVP